jgi:hypothetical protein
MFLKYYNDKKIDTIALSIRFFLQNFYFIYLFCVALCRLLLELKKVHCSIVLKKFQLLLNIGEVSWPKMSAISATFSRLPYLPWPHFSNRNICICVTLHQEAKAGKVGIIVLRCLCQQTMPMKMSLHVFLVLLG